MKGIRPENEIMRGLVGRVFVGIRVRVVGEIRKCCKVL